MKESRCSAGFCQVVSEVEQQEPDETGEHSYWGKDIRVKSDQKEGGVFKWPIRTRVRFRSSNRFVVCLLARPGSGAGTRRPRTNPRSPSRQPYGSGQQEAYGIPGQIYW